MSREFYSVLSQAGHWHFVPLEVRKGRLSHEVPVRDGLDEDQTKGNHAILLYLSRHTLVFELDAVVACVSDHNTLIAHVRRNPCGVDIQEALDAEDWARLVTDEWAVSAHQYAG